jgi:hypothetical protein
MALVSWETLSRSKEIGGWGIKNLNKFTKGPWKLINGVGMWQEILYSKYIAPISIENWIRSPQKSHKGGSNFSKALSQAAHLITKHLC